MGKLSPELKLKYRDYVRDADESPSNLGFLLTNLGYEIQLDYSRESLVRLEQIYWELHEKGMPADLSDIEHFAQMLGQYLGVTIIQKTGAKWFQCTDENAMYGQPCLDGFGNKKWDKIYPVALANNLPTLKRQNPNFPGVRDRTVLASQFDKALKISEGNVHP